MSYKIANIYNHNTILATEDEKNYVLIVKKGIGFGRKTGQLIDNLGEDKKIFYILEENPDESRIKQIGIDFEKIHSITKEIVEISQEKLNITNDKLFDALLDHISFAIQRLNLGLSIENPFIDEIAILYGAEFEIAKYAAGIIKQKLKINIGYDECGFIALHLYSARKQRPVNATLKATETYSKIIDLISAYFNKKIDKNSTPCRSFLLSLAGLVGYSAKNITFEMNIMSDVQKKLKAYHKIATEIGEVLNKEMGITLSKEYTAFLAVDIYKFIQM